jgi:hypothetical protein
MLSGSPEHEARCTPTPLLTPQKGPPRQISSCQLLAITGQMSAACKGVRSLCSRVPLGMGRVPRHWVRVCVRVYVRARSRVCQCVWRERVGFFRAGGYVLSSPPPPHTTPPTTQPHPFTSADTHKAREGERREGERSVKCSLHRAQESEWNGEQLSGQTKGGQSMQLEYCCGLKCVTVGNRSRGRC